MRRTIVTAVIGEKCKPMASLTLPTQEAYAKRLGADFIVFENTPECLGMVTAHWAKFAVGDLLKKYDEVLWIDADVIINPNAPSIFEASGGMFASFCEGDIVERNEQFFEYFKHLRGKEIRGRLLPQYFNSGVMVVPRSAAEIFDMPSWQEVKLTTKLKQEQPERFFYDQNFLNAVMIESNIPMTKLDMLWNLMNVPAGDLWEKREHAWFIHYAGLLNCMGDDLLKMIKTDLQKWGCCHG